MNHRIASRLYRLAALTMILACAVCAPAAWSQSAPLRLEAIVVKVYDGDTVSLRDSRSERHYTVHLAGVDAPIRATRETRGQEPWGATAQQFLSVWLAQRPVTAQIDLDSMTAQLWADGLHVNAEILRQGHAMCEPLADTAPYASELRAAEAAARAGGRGVWNPALPLTLRPSYVRRHAAELDADQGARERSLALPAFRDGCVVANRLTTLAYPPGHRHYENVRESPEALYFPSLESALTAGYTPANP